MVACQSLGQKEIVELLLSHGADVNTRDKVIFFRNFVSLELIFLKFFRAIIQPLFMLFRV